MASTILAKTLILRKAISPPLPSYRHIVSKAWRPSSFCSLAGSRSSRQAGFVLRSLSTLPEIVRIRISGVRCFATRPTTSSLNDPSPNWSNRPPKETILLDGCDFEHWLVVMEPPEGNPTRDEIIDSYIKTLAQILGSEEEARMKIYSVSTRHYFAFGALVSEELSYKIKALPRVRWVLPDSYLDVKNKDYGGEPFIDGKAVPYDPKYHEEWVRNNARANERSRRNDRPRNFDRSRNFERRRENMQNRDFQSRDMPPPPMPNRDFQSSPGTQNPMPGVQPGNVPNNNFQGGPMPYRDSQGPPGAQNPISGGQPGNTQNNFQGGPMPNRDFQRPPGTQNPIPGVQPGNNFQGNMPNSNFQGNIGGGGFQNRDFGSGNFQNRDMGNMPSRDYQGREMPNNHFQGSGYQGNNFQNTGFQGNNMPPSPNGDFPPTR